MMIPMQPMLLWALAIVQGLGLMSALLARLGEGRRCQTQCQRFFLACLALVGCSTLVCLAVGPTLCITSGTVLASMVLGATWDMRPQSTML